MNSKECLEKLKSMPTCSECELYGSCFDKPLCNELYNTIKQDLDKLEKLEKVIDILRRKILIVKTPDGIEFRIYEKITQQDYMLLQEVLLNKC